MIFQSVELHQFIELTSFLDLAHIHNYGISFGLFAGILPPWFIILIISLVTIIVFILMLKANTNVEKWGLLFIFSGAISNLLDRVINKYVLDFIYFHYNSFYWPAFNFADIYITVGVLLVIYAIVNNLILEVSK